MTSKGTIAGKIATPDPIPKLELDLIWVGAGKNIRGVDVRRTKELFGDKPISPMQAICFNEIYWNFSLSIYNNSTVPAFNISINPIEGQGFFSYIDKLSKVNNLASLANTDLEAKFTKYFNGTGKDAIAQFKGKYIPDELIGQIFQVQYSDEKKNVHTLDVTITDEGFTNKNRE